jgi:lysozyme
MQMSENGKKLLTEWEGFKLEVYKDSAGLDTIGVGHLLTKTELESGNIVIDGTAVPYHHGLTKQQVMDLLGQDLKRFEKAINDNVTVALNQNQFDALVSFAFNVGVGNFERSTLLKVLNQGKYDEVPNQLRRWNKAGGRVVQGLINRREKEINLWNS